MNSGNGAVDFILYLVALTLVVAFSSAVFAKDYLAMGVDGAGLLACLGVQQYLKKFDRRSRKDDG